MGNAIDPGVEEFNELWNKIMSNTSDKPPLPEVDFSREMLIVAAMGFQPSAYEIIIDSACEVDNQLEVLVRSTKFLPSGAYAGLLPEAVDIVRLPKTDLPVVFRKLNSRLIVMGYSALAVKSKLMASRTGIEPVSPP
jgi:hypothetical protein